MGSTETLEGAFDGYAAAHRRKKRWRITVACLAVLVAAGTVYALMTSASTLEGKTYCGLEEHAHSDDCYESVLVCGFEEEVEAEGKAEEAEEAEEEAGEAAGGHAHDEDCYEQALVCELEEHAHVDECYVNPDEEASAEAETAALPAGAQVPDGYTELYTARDDAEGFAVTVYAPEGALPDGVTLNAALISEDDDAYAQAEEALAASLDADLSSEEEPSEDGSDEAGYGFAALDIHFADAEGNEVEPTSEVYVVIDADGLLPEDADPDTLAVQHHAESDGTVTVETVADAGEASEGVVAAADDTGVQAAFAVDGFSTFTISWRSGSTTYFRVTVYYVDEKGTEIQGPQTSNVTAETSGTTQLSTYMASSIIYNGNTYTNPVAHYGSYSGSEVTYMTFSQSGNTRTLTFYNGNSTVGTLRYTTQSGTQTADVYLVYTSSSGGETTGGGDGGSTSSDATVSTSKTAVENEDGNYDLTLTISGTVGSETNKAPVDVLFIVDLSRSMQGTLLTNMKNAMIALIETLDADTAIDVMYNIIGFNSNATKLTSGWTSNSTGSVTSVINNLNDNSLSQNTNYQAGLEMGVTELNDARSNATKVVIFLSDGDPNRANNNLSISSRSSQGWINTLNTASSISCNYFFAISIGSSATDYLKDLGDYVQYTNSVEGDSQYPVYEAASDGSNLGQYFTNIAEAITTFSYAEDVTVSDQLSQWVDIVTDASDNPRLTIVVTDTNNERSWDATGWGTVELDFLSADGTTYKLTASYNSNTKTITLDFPDDYQLEAGYTYSVSTEITASDAAKDEGMDSEAAQQTPDDDTGTYADAGEMGFLSNDEATVTYKVNNEDRTAYFSKPVIQLTKMDFTFYKIDSETEDAVTGAEFLLYRSSDNYYYYEDPETGAVSWVENRNDATTLSGSGGTFTIKDLQVGTYYLEEVTVPNGYLYLSNPVTITISKDDNKNIVVTQVFCGTTDLDEYIDTTGRSFSVTNTTGQELPSAGGPGTTLITCAGVALVVIAGCGYGLRRIRERRGDFG